MAETTKKTEEVVVAKKPDFVEIVLPMPSSPNEPRQEFFSVNGKNYIIQCGKPVKVPYAIKEILDHRYEMENIQRDYVEKTYRELSK